MNLPSYLKSQEYIEIPFRKTAIGQIEVRVKVNGEDAGLVIDTGATGTVFDEASAERLHLKPGGVAVAAGLGAANMMASACNVETMEIGSCRIADLAVRIVDLSVVRLAMRQRGVVECDGVLGSDILIGRAAVIDYRCMKLYLKEGSAP